MTHASQLTSLESYLKLQHKLGAPCRQCKAPIASRRNIAFCGRVCRNVWCGKNNLSTGPAWNKGIPHSEATKAKMSQMSKGKQLSESTKRKISESLKKLQRHWSPKQRAAVMKVLVGRTVSAETKAKISLARKGKPTRPHTESFKLMLSITRRGELNPMYGRKGQQSPNWKGGVSLEPGYASFLGHRYRVKLRASGGKHSFRQWKELKQLYGFRCISCGRPETERPLTEDHIVPVARGGTDDISNIQPLCLSCNSRKLTRIICYAHLTEYLS